MSATIKKATKAFYLPTTLTEAFDAKIREKKESGDIPSNTTGSSVIETLMHKYINGEA